MLTATCSFLPDAAPAGPAHQCNQQTPRRKQGTGSVEREFSKGCGDDYVAAEDRTPMFCGAKYNSMNCFTVRSVCQQSKGRMALPTIRFDLGWRSSRKHASG
ncbi:MAG: hypothetical protein EOR60_30615 [Mesorhizobium sp.]|nr:MAG: hypothetical protein EOR60_30615 [Mesorhizobium sp.]